MQADTKEKVEVGPFPPPETEGGEEATIAAVKELEAEAIAGVCHEANAAYCRTIGDHSHDTWEDAPAWQRESAVKGVLFHLANPDAGPDHSHVEWMKEKLAAGWTHGAEKDPEAKTHPCLVAFDLLPLEQRIKDCLFKAVVHGMVPELADLVTADYEIIDERTELEKRKEAVQDVIDFDSLVELRQAIIDREKNLEKLHKKEAELGLVGGETLTRLQIIQGTDTRAGLLAIFKPLRNRDVFYDSTEPVGPKPPPEDEPKDDPFPQVELEEAIDAAEAEPELVRAALLWVFNEADVESVEEISEWSLEDRIAALRYARQARDYDGEDGSEPPEVPGILDRALGLEEGHTPAELEEGDEPVTPDELRTVLLLVMHEEHVPSVEELGEWTQEERDEAAVWATVEHIAASDNDDLERLPKPERIVQIEAKAGPVSWVTEGDAPAPPLGGLTPEQLDAEILAVVESELEENPDASNGELYDMIEEHVDSTVKTRHTQRQFGARFPLKVKRAKAAAAKAEAAEERAEEVAEPEAPAEAPTTLGRLRDEPMNNAYSELLAECDVDELEEAKARLATMPGFGSRISLIDGELERRTPPAEPKAVEQNQYIVIGEKSFRIVALLRRQKVAALAAVHADEKLYIPVDRLEPDPDEILDWRGSRKDCIDGEELDRYPSDVDSPFG